MPRKYIPISSEHPYHVSNRCHNKDFFPVPMPRAWQIFCDELYYTQNVYNLVVHSFVLMDNHYHLLVTAPDANLSDAIGNFNRETAKKMNKESGKINQIWGSRYFRSQIINDHYFYNLKKYIYRNPVEAGLTNKVENYKYSTLYGLIGSDKLHIAAHDDELILNLNETLNWLNAQPKPHYIDYIRKGLRRSTFGLAKVHNRDNPLESEIL